MLFDKMKKALEHFATAIRKDLGLKTQFFISDFCKGYHYRFTNIDS